MKTYDVTALGELLIDFTENGISGQGNPVLEANPGEHHAMYYLCCQSLGIKEHLSEKSVMICLAIS